MLCNISVRTVIRPFVIPLGLIPSLGAKRRLRARGLISTLDTLGEGANIEPNLTSSLFIYLFIYMHQPRSSCARIGILALVNSLKQKLI